MKYSLISDMHVDFPQPKTPYDLLEKNVIVAGDTSNGLEGLKFLQKLRNKGFNVLAVDGNHEHYSNARQFRSTEETTARFRENHPSSGEIDTVPVVLRNGWYLVEHEALWLGYMNDGRMSSMSAEDVNNRAKNDAYYIAQTLRQWRDYNLKGIVVTHTAPTRDTLNPAYAGHYSDDWYFNPMMGELLEKFSEQILVWNHGHTHAPADKIVHGVRVVCNPRGYPGENPNWRPQTIEVAI